MLYAGCSGCGRIQPLRCVGMSMPHVAIPAVQTAGGIGCQRCGIGPQLWTCGTCGITQLFYARDRSEEDAPNQESLSLALARGLRFSPVIKAAPTLPQAVLKHLFKQFAGDLARSFGEEIATRIIGAVLRH